MSDGVRRERDTGKIRHYFRGSLSPSPCPQGLLLFPPPWCPETGHPGRPSSWEAGSFGWSLHSPPSEWLSWPPLHAHLWECGVWVRERGYTLGMCSHYALVWLCCMITHVRTHKHTRTYNMRLGQATIHCFTVRVRDKPKAPRPLRGRIPHDNRVCYFAVLVEVFFQRVFVRGETEAADEYFTGLRVKR